MMIKDVIEQNQKTLRALESESAKALDVVNNTINLRQRYITKR